MKDEFPGLNIKIRDCIKQCGACREMPIATVDKRKVSGRDGDELYKNIIEAISKDESDK